MSALLVPDPEQLFGLIPKTRWLRNIIIAARGFCGVVSPGPDPDVPVMSRCPGNKPDNPNNSSVYGPTAVRCAAGCAAVQEASEIGVGVASTDPDCSSTSTSAFSLFFTIFLGLSGIGVISFILCWAISIKFPNLSSI